MYPSCGEQIENNFSPCTLNFCVRLFTYLREIYVTELNAIILSLSLNCAIFSLSKFIQIKLSVNYLFNHAHEVALLAMVDGTFLHVKEIACDITDATILTRRLIAKKLSKYI